MFLLFGALIAWSFGRVGRGVINDHAQFQALYEQLALWLDIHGIALARLWADHFNASWLIRLVQTATARVNTTLSFWIIVVIYLVLGLLEVNSFARKVQRMENKTTARVIAHGTAAAAEKLRRYMLVRTLMSVLTGLLVWAFAAVIGLNYAVEWGVIAFVLNYIPFIGSFIATLLPTLFALAQFASWQLSLAVFVCLNNVIQFAVGSYIEPRVSRGCPRNIANDRGGVRVLLGFPVGTAWRVHRRSDRHRPAGICRRASGHPLVGRSLGRRREGARVMSKMPGGCADLCHAPTVLSQTSDDHLLYRLGA